MHSLPFLISTQNQNTYIQSNIEIKLKWHAVANVLFLESPAGVGFSYSENKTDINNVGDKRTAEDSYIFLVNWLERFPQYKYRDFFITGESYAGHYVPQLAYTILSNNKHNANHYINLNGIAIGNAWIDDLTGSKGTYDYWWTHALISDETYNKITKLCDYATGHFSIKCEDAMNKAIEETGPIDIYSIYAPECYGLAAPGSMIGSIKEFDPCSGQYMDSYLNLPTVQAAFHARPTNWSQCGFNNGYWADAPTTVLPIIRKLMTNGISVWIYSGDTDGRVPVTSSRYAINLWKLPVRTSWRQWYAEGKDGVGGYVEEYKRGLTFVTVRGAGHIVPSYQPERALTMFSAFLQGKLPS